MEGIEKICEFLKKTGTYYLATQEDGQPHVRPFGTAHIYEGKLYIQTGKSKPVSKQMDANPKVEICAFNGSDWLRLEGEVMEDPSVEAQASMLEAYPELQAMYKAGDGNTIVYYFRKGKATISSFTHEPEVIEFSYQPNLEQVKGHLIVSCQALPNEPLHSSYIMGKMAKAALEGGAKGIRANTVEDIKEIKSKVDLPVIGIIKRVYGDNPVFITPTMKEIDELMEVQPDIIAFDATDRIRPDGKTLDQLYQEVREKYPNQKLMADCSTLEEMKHADDLGFDFIGTTLVGYTEESKGMEVQADDFKIIQDLVAYAKHPVIAEGNIDTPQKARRVLDIGCFSVVVGSIITRPQLITKRFVAEIEK